MKDFPQDFDDDASNEAIVAKIIKCPVEDLKDYGSVALLKIYDFLYENLLPKNFRAPLSENLKKQGR